VIYKILKNFLSILGIIIIIWGFSDSYSSRNIDNIVHVVAIGVDKSENAQNNVKLSFQFINMSGGSSGSEASSSGETSTIVTSINAPTVNKAINLMNSYIGKELNFSHCKVIVFSEEIAREGISSEICTFINNEEIRPSTNIVISTADAHSYLKNSNPNIEKIVTNYYDTFELTSNFTGYSDDTTLGDFYNKLFHPYKGNTAILGRTFKKASVSNSSGDNSQGDDKSSNEGDSQGDSQNSTQGQNSSNEQSSNTSGQSSGGNNSQNDSGDASLEISGERGTQNVGIAVFKDDKYTGQLSEIDSICHLLLTNNVDSFLISVPMENYPDNTLDLSVSPTKSTKITVDTSSEQPHISISVFCKANVLTIDENLNYENSQSLKKISEKSEKVLK